MYNIEIQQNSWTYIIDEEAFSFISCYKQKNGKTSQSY